MVASDPQLYIALAILVAAAAIVTPIIRQDNPSPPPIAIPKLRANFVTLVLLYAVMVSVGHILMKMLILTDYSRSWIIVEVSLHSLVVLAIMFVVLFWYWAVNEKDDASAVLRMDPGDLES